MERRPFEEVVQPDAYPGRFTPGSFDQRAQSDVRPTQNLDDTLNRARSIQLDNILPGIKHLQDRDLDLVEPRRIQDLPPPPTRRTMRARSTGRPSQPATA